MEDLREHIRMAMVCRIKILHKELGEMLVQTRDISDGGVFVVLDQDLRLPIGDVVQGQVQGLAQDAPILEMKVVRLEPTGVGLKFIQE